MLSKGEHVKSVWFNENGVIERTKEGAIIVDISSICPVQSKEFTEALESKGIEMLLLTAANR